MPLGQRRDRHRRPVSVPQFGGEIALQVGGHPRRVVVHLGMHDEDAPIQPRGAYATSKHYGEEALLALVARGCAR